MLLPPPTSLPASRCWVLLLLPYHVCCRVVCWFYRNSSGENVFDMVSGAACELLMHGLL